MRKLTDREHDLIDQLGIENFKLKKELSKITAKEVAKKMECSHQYILKRWRKLNECSREIDTTNS